MIWKAKQRTDSHRRDDVHEFINDRWRHTYREGRKMCYTSVPQRWDGELPCPSREAGPDNYARMTDDGTLKRKKEKGKAVDPMMSLRQQRKAREAEHKAFIRAIIVSIETL
jgi:hypothetical protein|tara:strand:+ start:1225 stop:1557 length:333 start_codon:yes stop_codon:yes gene_type:complete